MKKSTVKTGERKARPVAVEAVGLERVTAPPLDMKGLRGRISDAVCAEAVGMVGATIDQARGGHYQAMKYLFEMIGLFPASAMEDVPQEDSLAGMLLSRLGIRGEAPTDGEQGNPRTEAEFSGNDVK